VTEKDVSGLLTVTVKDTGKVEKFVNPQHVEDVYPEGTDVRVRLYPREYVAVVFELNHLIHIGLLEYNLHKFTVLTLYHGTPSKHQHSNINTGTLMRR
tara:strand:+ start:149 stop:442 length:294 start_codon:yes stop_codon:yes gene_type:complete